MKPVHKSPRERRREFSPAFQSREDNAIKMSRRVSDD
jgi:hypothetical protein